MGSGKGFGRDGEAQGRLTVALSPGASGPQEGDGAVQFFRQLNDGFRIALQGLLVHLSKKAAHFESLRFYPGHPVDAGPVGNQPRPEPGFNNVAGKQGFAHGNTVHDKSGNFEDVVFPGIHAASIATAGEGYLPALESLAFGDAAELYQPCYRLFDRAKSAYSGWPAV
jgi:hypothetical protein